MITSLRQPAQEKRRTDSGIVGQTTTDEPIDRARSPVLSYMARSYLHRRAGARYRFDLQRLSRCRAYFSPVVPKGALHRQGKQPSPLWRFACSE
jgi:hypothetical protein